MGILAPQGTKQVVMMVIRRSRSFSMVREAMTPGTPQPEPMSMGMKLLPERPNLRKIRSIMKATRAIYPTSSSNASIKNSTSIWGTKPSTAPTPATMPSDTSPVSHSAQPQLSSRDREPSWSHALPSTSLVQSVRKVPKGPIAIQ